MNRTILILLSLLVAAAGVYPVIYFLSGRTVDDLAHSTSYESARIQLGHEIAGLARDKACRGVVAPPPSVEGFDNSLSGVHADVMIALMGYDGWEVRTPDDVRKQVEQRFNRDIKGWEGLIDPSVFERQLRGMASAVVAQYSVRSAWKRSRVNSRGNDTRLSVVVTSQQRGVEVFTADVEFLHPATLELYKTRSAWLTVSLQALAGSSFLLLGYVAVGLTTRGLAKRKIRKEVLKRDDLVREGHFVTTLELVDKYLAYVPDDMDVKAFRERLLDFTNNDPKRAQIAFVEAKRLKLRMAQYETNPHLQLLSPPEHENIRALAPYHPDLSAYYAQVKLIEDKKTRDAELSERVEEIRRLLAAGRIVQAGGMLKEQQRIHPGHEELIRLESELQDHWQRAREGMQTARNHLANGSVSSALAELEKLTATYVDSPDAGDLLGRLRGADGRDSILLKPVSGGVAVELFGRTEVLFGRADVDAQPDVGFSDRRISRQHLRLNVLDDRVIVEDLGSTGGSYVNGNKITSTTINDGDDLNLSRYIEFTVRLHRLPDGRIGGVLLSGADRILVIVCTGLPLRVAAAGVTLDASGCMFFHEHQTFLAVSDGDAEILAPGKETTILGPRYLIEEMKG